MKALVLVLVLFASFVFLVPETDAQIYKWVDKDGIPHFSNVPGSGAEKAEKFLPDSVPESRRQKKCVEPDFISGPSGQYVSHHEWSKYLDCLKTGGEKVIPWKEK